MRFQKNPIKPKETGELPLRGLFFPLRYAQDTKTHSNAVYIEDLVFPNFLDVVGKKVWVGKLILCKKQMPWPSREK